MKQTSSMPIQLLAEPKPSLAITPIGPTRPQVPMPLATPTPFSILKTQEAMGPVIAETVKQFWKDVVWGDVDYMFIDMPPGTGDVPLTVFQSIAIDGIIIVTSPQELVGMIVDKAVKMAEMMNVPILGIVENMSYFKCPDCGGIHHIFGESQIEAIAAKHNIPVVCKLPIDPAIAAKCDRGAAEEYEGEWLDPMVDFLEKMR